jgi:hypothetical protein
LFNGDEQQHSALLKERREEALPFVMVDAGNGNQKYDQPFGRRTVSQHDSAGLSVPFRVSKKFKKQAAISNGRRNSNSQVKEVVVKGRVSCGSTSSCGSISKSNKAIRKSKNKIKPRKSKDCLSVCSAEPKHSLKKPGLKSLMAGTLSKP